MHGDNQIFVRDIVEKDLDVVQVSYPLLHLIDSWGSAQNQLLPVGSASFSEVLKLDRMDVA